MIIKKTQLEEMTNIYCTTPGRHDAGMTAVLAYIEPIIIEHVLDIILEELSGGVGEGYTTKLLHDVRIRQQGRPLVCAQPAERLYSETQVHNALSFVLENYADKNQGIIFDRLMDKLRGIEHVPQTGAGK